MSETTYRWTDEERHDDGPWVTVDSAVMAAPDSASVMNALQPRAGPGPPRQGRIEPNGASGDPRAGSGTKNVRFYDERTPRTRPKSDFFNTPSQQETFSTTGSNHFY